MKDKQTQSNQERDPIQKLNPETKDAQGSAMAIRTTSRRTPVQV
jgi:hypothetical protein